VPLPREHGGHPRAPDFLDRREDFELVVDDHIVIARISPLKKSVSNPSKAAANEPVHFLAW
jgi:hypothetical protein